MAAALPYVDDMIGCHNLAGLCQLAELLSAVGAQRPGRQQHARPSEPALATAGEPQADWRTRGRQRLLELIAEYPIVQVVSRPLRPQAGEGDGTWMR